MKKMIFTLVFLLSFGWVNTAQAFSFDWGVTGGYTLTKLKLKGDLSDNFKSENRPGWFAGAKINIGLFMGFGLDGALIYSQRKVNMNNYESDGYFHEYNSSETQRSIELPINIKYSIGLGKAANIYLTTGPQFDFNIGDDDWYDDYYNPHHPDRHGYYFERENVTSSWNVGGGVKLFGHLDLGVVYNFGISKFGEDVLEGITGTNWHTSEARSNNFKVQLTYFF